MPYLPYLAPLAFAIWGPSLCHADWTKTIDCPAGRTYRDVREPGRDEFCTLQLPGSLEVRDGPTRWWYGEGHLGEEGTYKDGRKIGRWRECTRFDKCRDTTYEELYPEERAHAVKTAIPLGYSKGKYVFDFGSCRSTWVTRRTSESFLEINIYHGLVRCQVTYIPSTAKDRPAGNPQGDYFCELPYSLGTREFDSLDLRSELPKVGLPQFCRQDETVEWAPNGPSAHAVAFWGNLPFIDGRTGKKAVAWSPLANAVDVECASLNRQEPGRERLTLRLNPYAEQIVLERVAKSEVKVNSCNSQFPFLGFQLIHDSSGRTLFTMLLSSNPATAKLQHQCIAARLKLQPACAAVK